MSDEFQQLREWLTGEREVRSLSIDVRADDPDWGETDADVLWSWSYSITAHDVLLHGGGETATDGMISVTMHGEGVSIDDASRGVLDAIKYCGRLQWHDETTP